MPFPPRSGSTEDIVGNGIKVKPLSSPVPPRLVTLTAPEEPAARTASIVVLERTLKEAASVDPNFTEVT